MLTVNIMAAFFSCAMAQNTELFRSKLAAPDSVYKSSVEIVVHPTAAKAISSMPSPDGDEKIKGYRVRIFFDNGQNARMPAVAAQNRFREMFPDVPTYMSYDNPYFKVTVGNCLTMEEAIILWGKVKGSFDRAFVVREEFPLSKLAE